MREDAEGRAAAARDLAEEFGTRVATMEAFLGRFAPRWTVADQFRETSDVLLFVHIPKTAGVSIGASLGKVFHPFRPVQWSEVAASFRYHMRYALYMQSQVAARQVMIGHFGWPELSFWLSHQIPLKCATVFRDPLARLVSNYDYNCSTAHPPHESFRERYPTLFDYARDQVPDVQLSQAIGMFGTFDRALEKFIAHYSFLGVTEHLARGLRQLSRTHGLAEMAEARVNVGQGRAQEPVPPAVADLVAKLGHNDIKIHRLLTRLYEEAEG